MSKIRIKNFGPIREGFDSADGFMDITNITVFTGDQGSGKRGVAKLISILTWIEKAINRDEIKIGTRNFNWFSNLCRYQGIQNYFLHNTEIEYRGKGYYITLPVKYAKNR